MNNFLKRSIASSKVVVSVYKEKTYFSFCSPLMVIICFLDAHCENVIISLSNSSLGISIFKPRQLLQLPLTRYSCHCHVKGSIVATEDGQSNDNAKARQDVGSFWLIFL